MKKTILLSLLSLSLVSGAVLAATPVYEGGVQIVNNTSNTAIGHVYNANNLIIGDAIYAPANSSTGIIGFKKGQGLTTELYAGVSAVSASGGVDAYYTTCFHDHTNQSFIFSTNPASNQFSLTSPPTCNTSTSK